MGLRFEWDNRKERSNITKHGVSFEEARTILGDPLSLTIADTEHEEGESRFAMGAAPLRADSWLSRTWKGATLSASSVRDLRIDERRRRMKKVKTAVREPEMRAEYDFRGGVRGKYAARYAEGTNVVLLEPDVAELFPDSRTVNEALRALVAIVDRRRPRKPRAATVRKARRS